jgi:hypothetical protein
MEREDETAGETMVSIRRCYDSFNTLRAIMSERGVTQNQSVTRQHQRFQSWQTRLEDSSAPEASLDARITVLPEDIQIVIAVLLDVIEGNLSRGMSDILLPHRVLLRRSILIYIYLKLFNSSRLVREISKTTVGSEDVSLIYGS